MTILGPIFSTGQMRAYTGDAGKEDVGSGKRVSEMGRKVVKKWSKSDDFLVFSTLHLFGPGPNKQWGTPMHPLGGPIHHFE